MMVPVARALMLGFPLVGCSGALVSSPVPTLTGGPSISPSPAPSAPTIPIPTQAPTTSPSPASSPSPPEVDVVPIPLSGAGPIALQVAGDEAWIATYDGGSLVAVDLAQQREARAFEVAGGPSDLLVDCGPTTGLRRHSHSPRSGNRSGHRRLAGVASISHRGRDRLGLGHQLPDRRAGGHPTVVHSLASSSCATLVAMSLRGSALSNRISWTAYTCPPFTTYSTEKSSDQ